MKVQKVWDVTKAKSNIIPLKKKSGFKNKTTTNVYSVLKPDFLLIPLYPRLKTEFSDFLLHKKEEG